MRQGDVWNLTTHLKYGSGKVPEGRRIVWGVGTFRVRGGWLPVIHCSDL